MFTTTHSLRTFVGEAAEAPEPIRPCTGFNRPAAEEDGASSIDGVAITGANENKDEDGDVAFEDKVEASKDDEDGGCGGGGAGAGGGDGDGDGEGR
jgi:hypothetical protein